MWHTHDGLSAAFRAGDGREIATVGGGEEGVQNAMVLAAQKLAKGEWWCGNARPLNHSSYKNSEAMWS